MQTSRIVLLHDSASTAACTQALLDHFYWQLFDHPPYSPDLAPSDFHLKNWLESQRFNNNEGIDGMCQNVAELTGGRLL
jgi:hypothetical protein